MIKSKSAKKATNRKGAPMNPNLVRMTKGGNPKLRCGVHPDDVESYKSKGWNVDQ